MTTLIKNIQLIDGTGKAAVKTDLLTKGRVISAIGNLTGYKANETIDGMGAFLSPGFIDIHATADRYLTLFSAAHQKNILLQGITTIIGGQDGVSLAPLLYGTLDLIRDWADPREVNVNWHTMAEFLKTMEKKKLAFNFGTLAGWKTIEHSVRGEAVRGLTSNEFRVAAHLLDAALSEGAFGLSLGSDYFHIGRWSFYDVKNLLKIVAKHRALFATELQGREDEQIVSLNRIISLVEEAGVRTEVSHLAPKSGSEPIFEKSIELIAANSARADILFDVYPTDTSVFPICAILPPPLFDKEKSETENIEEILEKLKDEKMREETEKSLPKFKVGDITIVAAPGHKYLRGKSLREYAQNRDLPLAPALTHLIEFTEGRAIIAYKNVNAKMGLSAAGHSRAIIASSEARPKEAKKSSFLKFLEAAGKENILPIEAAIRKLTALPAQRLGLKRRGVIRIGNLADLVVFRGAEIKEVIVNGQRAVKEGKVHNASAGWVLRRH